MVEIAVGARTPLKAGRVRLMRPKGLLQLRRPRSKHQAPHRGIGVIGHNDTVEVEPHLDPRGYLDGLLVLIDASAE